MIIIFEKKNCSAALKQLLEQERSNKGASINKYNQQINKRTNATLFFANQVKICYSFHSNSPEPHSRRNPTQPLYLYNQEEKKLEVEVEATF